MTLKNVVISYFAVTKFTLMIISAIVAMSKNRAIGKGNKIPWHLPADLKYFKRTTIDHHIILGRKCYESIGRPLPNRTNIVVTRDIHYKAEGCVIVHSIEAALDYARHNGETEVFIAGGGEIYRQTQHLWDKLYLTEVDIEVDGDVFFCEINDSEWIIHTKKENICTEKNPYNHTFKTYNRKK